MPSITEIVKNRVHFESYRNGIFLYKVIVSGVPYTFPVPLEDVEGATLPKEEKGIFFMRWIRKALASNEFITTSSGLINDPVSGKVLVVEDGKVIGVQG